MSLSLMFHTDAYDIFVFEDGKCLSSIKKRTFSDVTYPLNHMLFLSFQTRASLKQTMSPLRRNLRSASPKLVFVPQRKMSMVMTGF